MGLQRVRHDLATKPPLHAELELTKSATDKFQTVLNMSLKPDEYLSQFFL